MAKGQQRKTKEATGARKSDCPTELKDLPEHRPGAAPWFSDKKRGNRSLPSFFTSIALLFVGLRNETADPTYQEGFDQAGKTTPAKSLVIPVCEGLRVGERNSRQLGKHP